MNTGFIFSSYLQNFNLKQIPKYKLLIKENDSHNPKQHERRLYFILSGDTVV